MRYLTKYIFAFLFLIFLSFSSFSQVIADFSYQINNKCTPSIVIFNNLSSGSGTIDCEWDFGTGTFVEQESDTLKIYFYTPGDYSIRLKATNGIDTDIKTEVLQFFKKPTAKFEIEDGVGCELVQAKFIDQSIKGSAPINKWEWDLRNGEVLTSQNAEYTYTDSGTYDLLLKVTDENNCIDYEEVEDEIMVNSKLLASFSSDKQFWCESAYFKFYNQTNSYQELNFKWYLSDGQTSTLENPLFFIDNEGMYDVSLVVSNESGCFDSIYIENYIVIENIEPSFKMFGEEEIFSKDTICPQTVSFEINSQGSVEYWWFVNDSLVGKTHNLEYDFFQPGEYEISSQVGIGECFRIAYATLFVDEIISDFSIDDDYACVLPSTFNFINQSGNGVNYLWEFPDGTQSTNENEQFEVTELDREENPEWKIETINVPIVLNAINERGCKATIEKNIEFTFPFARLVPNEIKGCVPLDIEFLSRSLSDSEIKNYTWMFGDGNQLESTKDIMIEHTYNNVGIYEAYLLVKNDSGCVDTSQIVEIKVGEKLEPDFMLSESTICNGTEILLTNLTENAEELDYAHFYSTGLFSENCTGVITVKTFAQGDRMGFYDVGLEVETNGCVSETIKENAINIKGPVVNFQSKTKCNNPLSYTFNSRIEDAETFLWDFGDGSTSTDENPVNSYSSTGDYTVVLSASNSANGCVDTVRQIIKVQKPEALFSTTPDDFACVMHMPYSDVDQLIGDCENSIGVDEGCEASGYIWNFGDNNIWTRYDSPTAKHNYTYKVADKVTVQLVVEDSKGCTDTLKREIDLLEPQLDFISDTSSGCHPGFDVEFTNLMVDNSVKEWYYIFKEGDTDTSWNKTIDNYFYELDYQPGMPISPMLTVFNDNGCSNQLSKNILYIKPDPDFFYNKLDNYSSKIEGACIGDEIYFNSTQSYNSDSCIWLIDSVYYHDKKALYAYDEWGTHNIQHTAYRLGCKDSTTASLIIEKAMANFVAYDTIQECNLELKFLHNHESGTVVPELSKWIFDNEDHEGAYRNDTIYFTYTKPGFHEPRLNIETKFGCKDTATMKVEILRPWAEYSISDGEICVGDSVSFHLGNSMYSTLFQWILEDNSTNELDTMVHVFNNGGKFIIGVHVENDSIPACTFDAPIEINVHDIVANFELDVDNNYACMMDIINTSNKSEFADSYLWKLNGNEITTDKTLSPFQVTETGNIELVLHVYNEYGCTDTANDYFSVMPFPSVEILNEYFFCEGSDSLQLITISDSEDNGFIWQPAENTYNPNEQHPYVKVANNTVFKVVVVSPYNCTNSDSVLVNYIPVPEITRLPYRMDTVIHPGAYLELSVQSTNESDYSWEPYSTVSSPNSAITSVYPEDSTVYVVSINDQCFSSVDTFYVSVHEKSVLDMPKAFMPKGNEANRVVYIRGVGITEVVDFQVFNKWGNLVFESNDISKGWDGYYKGELLPSGPYAYYVKAKNYMGKEYSKKGTILLLY